MNVRFFTLPAALSALVATVPSMARAASPEASALQATPLYVSMEASDSGQFERERHAFDQGGELILSTLKARAATAAREAGYPGEIVVLDEDAKAPDGASVLRLTWNDGVVTADLTEQGKEVYLGVVSRTDLWQHPDYPRFQKEINHNLIPAAQRDARLRVRTEMNLYVALKYLVDRQKPARAT